MKKNGKIIIALMLVLTMVLSATLVAGEIAATEQKIRLKASLVDDIKIDWESHFIGLWKYDSNWNNHSEVNSSCFLEFREDGTYRITFPNTRTMPIEGTWSIDEKTSKLIMTYKNDSREMDYSFSNFFKTLTIDITSKRPIRLNKVVSDEEPDAITVKVKVMGNYLRISRYLPLGNVTVSITGVILNEEGNIDAYNMAYFPLSYTDSNGRCDLKLREGSYQLSFTKKGFETQKKVITVKKGGLNLVHMVLKQVEAEEQIAVVFGQVFGIEYQSNGNMIAKPLTNAIVIVTSSDTPVEHFIDLETGVALVRMMVPGARTMTNEKGEYRISLKNTGTFSIYVIKRGYSWEVKGPFNIKAGDKINIDFILEPKIQEPELGWIHGKARQIFPGYRTMPRPLAGVRITAIRMMPYVNVSPSSQTITGVTYTQEDGSYKLRLRSGTYMITASKKEYSFERVMGVLIVSGEGTEQNFALKKINQEPENGWLYGRVLGKSSHGNISVLHPLSRARISIVEAIHHHNSTDIQQRLTLVTYTDEQGRYRVGLKPGIYIVTASKEGYSSYMKTDVVIISARHTEANFVLKEIVVEPVLGWLHGRVLGEETSGNISALFTLPGVRITAVPMVSHFNLSTIEQGETYVTYTNDNGSYKLRLRPGTYIVTASKNGYSSYIKTNVVIIKGEGTEENFVLKKLNISSVPIGKPEPITIKPIKVSSQIMLEKINIADQIILTEENC